MLDFDKNKKCFGCTVCRTICPQNAIEMKENKEGFLEPLIIEEKCIKCGICEKNCPALTHKTEEKIKPIKIISAIKRDKKKYKNYTSGGVFFELAQKIIAEDRICMWMYMGQTNGSHSYFI